MAESIYPVLHFALTVLFVTLGGMLLLAGRKHSWILLTAGGFLVAATLFAEFRGQPQASSLVTEGLWVFLLVAAALGILGYFVSVRYKSISIDLIGFAVGLYTASWFDEILLVLNGQEESDFTWWLAVLFIAAGALGVWITRREPDQAMILISVIIGADTITNALNLDSSRSITAVFTLGLALTGVVVQYATLLREQPRLGRRLPPVPHPVSEEMPYE